MRRTVTTERGLVRFRRTLTSAALVDLPFDQVKLHVGRGLGALVTEGTFDPAADVAVPARPLPRLLRVAVNVETWSPRGRRPGLLVHLRWRARHHAHLFPIMDVDVLARPKPEKKTELVVETTYRPPLGTPGLLVDLLVGRVVARSTVEAFLVRLADALESPLLGEPDVTGEGAGSPPVLRVAA